MLPDDGANHKTAAPICHLRSEGTTGGRNLSCHVHLGDADLRTIRQQTLAGCRETTRVKLQFFDVFDSKARRRLVHDLPDHAGVRPNEPRQVHLVILGIGRMGRTLPGGRVATSGAARWSGHFPALRQARSQPLD